MSNLPSASSRQSLMRYLTGKKSSNAINTKSLSRTEKLDLAAKLSDNTIDTFMILYVYMVFLACIIAIVVAYRYKDEAPFVFRKDRDAPDTLWTRFKRWLVLTPADSTQIPCPENRSLQPAASSDGEVQQSCSEINAMYLAGKPAGGDNAMC
jgi:hypothetical protein